LSHYQLHYHHDDDDDVVPVLGCPELMEEYSSLTKKIFRYCIVAITTLHALLLLDDFPPIRLAISASAYIAYWLLLTDFPNIYIFSIKSFTALCKQ